MFFIDLDPSLEVIAFYLTVILSSTALLIAFVKPYKRIADKLSDTLLSALLTLLSHLTLLTPFILISVPIMYKVGVTIGFTPFDSVFVCSHVETSKKVWIVLA